MHKRHAVADNSAPMTKEESQVGAGMMIKYYGKNKGARSKPPKLQKDPPRSGAKDSLRVLDNSFRATMQIRLHDSIPDIKGLRKEIRNLRRQKKPLTMEIFYEYVPLTLTFNNDRGPKLYAALKRNRERNSAARRLRLKVWL